MVLEQKLMEVMAEIRITHQEFMAMTASLSLLKDPSQRELAERFGPALDQLKSRLAALDAKLKDLQERLKTSDR